MLRILMIGGGTGGHVVPLVAVAEVMGVGVEENRKDIDVRFMGAGDMLVSEAARLKIPCYTIVAPKWRRYFSVGNFIDIFKVPIAFLQSLLYMWYVMPDVVFSKGGFASFFPLLAATLFFIPIVIHESDSVPGLVNRIFGKFASKVYLGFSSAEHFFSRKKTSVVGVPIRPQLLEQVFRDECIKRLGISSDKPVLFVGGGSQGAYFLNEALLLIVTQLVKKYTVIHQTGAANFESVRTQLGQIVGEEKGKIGDEIKASYKIISYLAAFDLAMVYSIAQAAIMRAGSQMFEVAARKIPIIVIPLDTAANNHQVLNAQEAARFGATIIMQENLKPHILMNEINRVIAQHDVLSERIAEFARADAADTVANYLIRGHY